MSLKQQLMQWNKQKWEEKNRWMYSQTSENMWPWYNDELDPDVEQYIQEAGMEHADILDVGTCSGSQAIALARRGHRLTGSDVSETALEKARAILAKTEGVSVDFVVDDIAESGFPDDHFDLILDRGCYHSICCLTHEGSVENVKRILRKGGLLLLKTMSSEEQRFVSYETIGGRNLMMPYLFERQELRGCFSDSFEVIDVRDSYFYSDLVDPPAKARFAIIKNTK